MPGLIGLNFSEILKFALYCQDNKSFTLQDCSALGMTKRLLTPITQLYLWNNTVWYERITFLIWKYHNALASREIINNASTQVPLSDNNESSLKLNTFWSLKILCDAHTHWQWQWLTSFRISCRLIALLFLTNLLSYQLKYCSILCSGYLEYLIQITREYNSRNSSSLIIWWVEISGVYSLNLE